MDYNPINPYAVRRPARRPGRGALPPLQQPRDWFATALMSFYFPGLGQIYCGAVGRGLTIMFGGPVLAAVSFLFIIRASAAVESAGGSFGQTAGPSLLVWGLLSTIGWLWQVFDAAMLARRS